MLDDQRDQRRADDIGAEHEQRQLTAGIELRGANLCPIGRIRRIVQAEQGTRIDTRLGELGGGPNAHAATHSAALVSSWLDARALRRIYYRRGKARIPKMRRFQG